MKRYDGMGDIGECFLKQSIKHLDYRKKRKKNVCILVRTKLEKYSWLLGEAKPYYAAKPTGIVAITQKLFQFSVLPFKLPNSLEIVFVNTRKTRNSSS